MAVTVTRGLDSKTTATNTEPSPAPQHLLPHQGCLSPSLPPRPPPTLPRREKGAQIQLAWEPTVEQSPLTSLEKLQR